MPFTNYQIKILIELAKNIINKYSIDTTYIIGHNDIAPGRKVDHGSLFPWKEFAKNVIEAWYNSEKVNQYKIYIEKCEIYITKKYGYKINITKKLDKQTKIVVQSF